MDDVTLHLPTPEGAVALRPASRAAERLVETYQRALHRWLTTGESRALRALGGQTVADAAGRSHALLADLDTLRGLAEAGELVFDLGLRRAGGTARRAGSQPDCY